MVAERNGNANEYTINLENFIRRLKQLYESWGARKTKTWGNTDTLAIATPPPSEDLRYLKSSALNIWLLGYEFPETIMVFMQKNIHFLCSRKKAHLLGTLKESPKEAIDVDINIHIKERGSDGIALIDEILQAIRSQSKSSPPVVGYLARETPEGKLLETWSKKLSGSSFQLVDVSNGFSELLAVKDASEITCLRKAAYLTASVMQKFVIPTLESIIDEDRKVSHAYLMNETEKAILNPMKLNIKLKAENVDICYPPIFQSGGDFDLRPSASSNDENLYYDPTSVIICAIGSRYNSYCSNIARSFIINGSNQQLKAYGVLLKAFDAAIGVLNPGKKISAVYEAVTDVVENEAPELLPKLTKSVGTSIGIEYRESGWAINPKNDKILQAGMTFNVSIGFHNLEPSTGNPKIKQFSLFIADTVYLENNEPAKILTSICSKEINDVTYSISEEEEEPVKEPVTVKEKAAVVLDATVSRTALRSDKGEVSKEEIRRQHQAKLAQRKNEETARRLSGVPSAAGDARDATRALGDLFAYKGVNDIPDSHSRELMILIDQKNEAILLPIHGILVPFHVAMVKSVTSHQDNRTCTVRIIFNVPGGPFNPHDANFLKFQSAIFLKEATFRSKDSRHTSEVVQQIKTLRRNVMSRESERAERATLVNQEKLQLANNKMKPTKLSDLWIRPTFGGRGRKLSGTLEAHVNGFKYTTPKLDERVEIMYGNIKHAFFQPAEREMITLLHFHLHNHIMVGTKKTKDVQLYVEVMDVVQTLGGGRRSALDPDEIEEEQRERDRKNKINMDFQNFVNKVHDIWGQPQFRGLDLEFDQPLRELGFHGVPHKTSVFVVPTSNCLVELVESPFLVVTLSEIEIVNLERVGFGQKNFDMAIVFKDFKRDVLRIDSIPSSSIDEIKDWLDTTDLKYYESRLNLNWRPVLKTIIEDPAKFIAGGGWEFLNLEGSDSDSDNSEESDQGYQPSDAEPGSESEEDDSGESFVESDDDDDEDEDSEEESEEEKGKTWDELEREASKADKERGDESDSEDDRRKKKAFGKARIPERKGPPPKKPKF